MRNLRFTIAAGETKRFEINGRYLEIIDAQGPVNIALSDQAGGTADTATAILSGTYMGTPYSGFTVYSATAQTVELFLSNTTGGTKRQPGVVQVVDGERNKVLSGVCFSGVAQIAGAAGGPRIQLWNGSTTRDVYLNAIRLGSSAADSWGLLTCTNVLNVAAPNAPENHDPSVGTSPETALRTDNAAQVLTGSRTYKIGYVAANADLVVVLPKPIRLRPGTGAVIYLVGTAGTLRATFEFEEWPI